VETFQLEAGKLRHDQKPAIRQICQHIRRWHAVLGRSGQDQWQRIQTLCHSVSVTTLIIYRYLLKFLFIKFFLRLFRYTEDEVVSVNSMFTDAGHGISIAQHEKPWHRGLRIPMRDLNQFTVPAPASKEDAKPVENKVEPAKPPQAAAAAPAPMLPSQGVCTVCHIVNPNKFYVQNKTPDVLMIHRELIHRAAQNSNRVWQMKGGEMFSVFDKDSGLWYRGKCLGEVEHVGPSSPWTKTPCYEFFLIDEGVRLQIPTCSVRELDPKLKESRPMLLECSLGLPLPDDDKDCGWSASIVDLFTQLAKGRQMQMKMVSKREDGVAIVDLQQLPVFTNENVVVSVRNHLIASESVAFAVVQDQSDVLLLPPPPPPVVATPPEPIVEEVALNYRSQLAEIKAEGSMLVKVQHISSRQRRSHDHDLEIGRIVGRKRTRRLFGTNAVEVAEVRLSWKFNKSKQIKSSQVNCSWDTFPIKSYSLVSLKRVVASTSKRRPKSTKKTLTLPSGAAAAAACSAKTRHHSPLWCTAYAVPGSADETIVADLSRVLQSLYLSCKRSLNALNGAE